MKYVHIYLLAILFVTTTKAEYTINDHIISYKSYSDASTFLSEHSLKNKLSFKNFYLTLSKKDKEKIIHASLSMEAYLPEVYLQSILYWKILKKNHNATRSILKWLIIHNLMLIKKNYLLTENQKYLDYIKELTGLNEFKIETLLTNYEDIINEKASILSQLSNEGFLEAIRRTPIISKVLDLEFNLLNDPMGIIQNNDVEYISQSDKSINRINWFISNQLSGDEDNESIAKIIKDHPNLKDDKVLISAFNLINEAKDNLLINVCCISDSLGLMLAHKIKEKFEQVILTNPDFKIFLNTTTTHPLIKFKNVDKIKSLLEEIKIKYPANFEYQYDLISKLPSISDDNSKVIVADMNTPNVQAYTTTKPFADFFGGFSYDSAILFKGPAAQLSAFRYLYELKKYSPSPIIEEFLKGSEDLSFSLGGSDLSLSQSGTIVNNSLGGILDVISSAKESISIDAHYFYDPNIVDTLVKVKIKNPEIAVNVLLDSNFYMNMNGFPNTTFIRELFNYGIKVKTRNTHIVKSEDSETIYQINNRNLIIVDSKIALSTSATFRPFSFVNSSIEFGITIYDSELVESIQIEFDSDWNDTNKTLDMNVDEFSAKFGDKSLSPDLSNLINHLMGFFLRQRH